MKKTLILGAALSFVSGMAFAAAVDVGSDLQVLWDDYIVDTAQTTAARVLHRPEYAGDVIKHDLPWEGDGCNYHCIFKDGDIYRMYYNGFSIGAYRKQPYPFKPSGVRICYAESKDGIHWTKPKLGLCEFNGSKENNIVIDKTIHGALDNFYVFKDPNPDCPKDELYKGITSYECKWPEDKPLPYGMKRHRRSKIDDGVKRDNLPFIRGLVIFSSPDPFNFKFNRGITADGAFDTLNIVIWNKYEKRYYCYCRGYHRVETDRNGDLSVRDIMVTTSDDGKIWTKPKLIDFGPDAEDYALYTNVVQPYPRNDKIWVGFPSRYVERKAWTPNYDRLPGVAERKERMKRHVRYGLTLSDTVFMMTRDGKTFQRDDEAFFRPGPQNRWNWVYGDCYPAAGLLVPTAEPEGAQDKYSMYFYEGHWMGEAEILKRYTIRQDGFVSRQAPYRGAKVVTKPLVFTGKELLINFSTSARGRMFVTVRSEDGRMLKSIELFGDQVDRPVDFEKDELASFAGKSVTLEFEMSDADLYAFRFR
jgi:hypothetical protein